MISTITGIITEVRQGSILLKVGPVSLELLVPQYLYGSLRNSLVKEEAPEATFFTIFYIEGGMGMGLQVPRLVGFPTQSDREFFLLYTSVDGLGVKKALRSLIRPVSAVADAVERGNVKALKELPQIGDRLAQKIVATLKGKVTLFITTGTGVTDENDSVGKEGTIGTVPKELVEEAMSVLAQLGYRDAESRNMIFKSYHPQIHTSEALLQAIFRAAAK